jgi:predicted secreted protein
MKKTSQLLTVLIAAGFLLAACATQTPIAGAADTSKNNASSGASASDATNTALTPGTANSGSADTSSGSGADIVITPGIKGTSVTLNVGQTFEIQIPTIPTPNYEWVPQNLDTAMLSQIGGSDYISASGTGSTSNGGFSVLKFKALTKGQTTISLLYVLSSADKSAPSLSAQSMSITVNVN